MSEETTCCGVLELLAEEYDLPFERPLFIRKESLDFGVAGWHVRLMKRTPSGSVSRKGQKLVALNFCPFCGKKLSKEEQNDLS